MIKKPLLFFMLAALSVAFSRAYGGGVIKKFDCKDGGNKVILQWISTIEISLEQYEIERSLDKKTFNRIAKVEAKGPSTYTYIDQSVFKQLSHTFYYRLKLVDKNGTSSYYGDIISIKPSISGVKHTWGSLKAMFR